MPWCGRSYEPAAPRIPRFSIDSIALFPRPTPLPGDVTGWLETFATGFIIALPAAERPAFVAEVRDALRPVLADAADNRTADYVRLRFAATRGEVTP